VSSSPTPTRPPDAAEQTLAGRVAVVTGGSRGIGAGIARALARHGAKVAITYTSAAQRAQELLGEIESFGGRAIALEADNRDEAALRAALQRVAREFGGLDVLVNNAGVTLRAGIDEVRMEDFQRVLAVNVTAVFVATQEALRHMKAGGRIINIGSSNTRQAPYPTASIYTLSKGALLGFARGLVRELGPRGITINTVLPGPVGTDMNPADGPHSKVVRPLIAVQRYGQTSEIGETVAFLAGPHAGFVTGAEILVDGGFTA
jgi:3-oxoacyl-[acyl-carrier protein] reductase